MQALNFAFSIIHFDKSLDSWWPLTCILHFDQVISLFLYINAMVELLPKAYCVFHNHCDINNAYLLMTVVHYLNCHDVCNNTIVISAWISHGKNVQEYYTFIA